MTVLGVLRGRVGPGRGSPRDGRIALPMGEPMWISALDRLLDHLVREGDLHLSYPDGQTRRYGDGQGPRIEAAIADEATVRRLALDPDLALGEAYMDGTFAIEDAALYDFLDLIMRNLAAGRARPWMRPFGMLRRPLRRLAQFNPAGRARANVAHHYDLSKELYELFLDADKQYSCAYFRHPDDTLEQAQAQKKAHIAGKLLLEPGMRVLDIGCGWGGMALTLARDHGAEVLGVTLSREQHAVATERARAAGLDGQVQFRLTDYRDVEGQFDRVVSVGMFEHVGVPHYREYFRHLRRLLTPEGVALIHTIGRSDPPGYTSPWIAKYIFPGGYIPALSETSAAIEREGLVTDDVEVWRLHYAETLRHWRARFEENLDKVRALYDERFCRMWRFYLVGSELSFRRRGQVVFQFQLSRNQEAVPLTREYLYHPPAAELARDGAPPAPEAPRAPGHSQAAE